MEDNLSIYKLVENRDLEQYFFSKSTVSSLTNLCTGQTACICMPSVAENSWKRGLTTYLFDCDRRMKSIYPNNSLFIDYDITKPLEIDQMPNKHKELLRYGFDTVMIDPPFGKVAMEKVAQNIFCMLKFDDLDGNFGQSYIVYPQNRSRQLHDTMLKFGMVGEVCEGFEIDYINRPKIITNELNPIRLFRFVRA